MSNDFDGSNEIDLDEFGLMLRDVFMGYFDVARGLS
jgi:hypothetical protein